MYKTKSKKSANIPMNEGESPLNTAVEELGALRMGAENKSQLGHRK